MQRDDRTITICDAKSYDKEYQPAADDVDSFHNRREAIEDLLKARRKPEHFINYCFIVRNGIKRNMYFNEINPVVVDLPQIL